MTGPTVLLRSFSDVVKIVGVAGHSEVVDGLLVGTFRLGILSADGTSTFWSDPSVVGSAGAPGSVRVDLLSNGMYRTRFHERWSFLFSGTEIPTFTSGPGSAACAFRRVDAQTSEEFEFSILDAISSRLIARSSCFRGL